MKALMRPNGATPPAPALFAYSIFCQTDYRLIDSLSRAIAGMFGTIGFGIVRHILPGFAW